MTPEYQDYLAHHGVKGQRWGHRRYQDENGEYTFEGRQHYGIGDPRGASPKENENSKSEEVRKEKVKNILKVAAGVTLAAAAGYAAYKFGGKLKDSMVRQATQKSGEALKEATRFSNLAEKADNRVKLDQSILQKHRYLPSDYKNGLIDPPSVAGVRLEDSIRSMWKYSDKSAKAASTAQRYSTIANTATRLKAIRNWIRNRGRIIV